MSSKQLVWAGPKEAFNRENTLSAAADDGCSKVTFLAAELGPVAIAIGASRRQAHGTTKSTDTAADTAAASVYACRQPEADNNDKLTTNVNKPSNFSQNSTYFAPILLTALAYLFCPKFCWQNVPDPNNRVVTH